MTKNVIGLVTLFWCGLNQGPQPLGKSPPDAVGLFFFFLFFVQFSPQARGFIHRHAFAKECCPSIPPQKTFSLSEILEISGSI